MSDSPTAASLASTDLIDSAHPSVAAFARECAVGGTDRERAVALHDAVRDGFRYDPYRVDLSPDGMRASGVVRRGTGWCVPKAALLAAACRAAGIPARVGYADVKNHLTTPALTAKMGTDLFVFHGYTDLFLDGKWVKATPAFNLAMCKRFRVKPLEFDGREDSIFHPFDEDNRRHMEYLNFRGTYADVPADEIRRVFAEIYPRYFTLGPDGRKESFEPA